MYNIMFFPVLFIALLANKGCLTFKAPVRPTFPDVFRADVEVTFVKESEADVTFYYDGPHNRAAFDIFYQNEDTRKIYLFDDSVILTITGSDCTVDPISNKPEESLFPFTIDESDGRKIIAPPENVIYFQNSQYLNDELAGSEPLYLYTGNVNILELNGCNITHKFTKPTFSRPNCDLRKCVTTLRTVILKCQNPENEEETALYQEYQVTRFRNYIDDYSVFQPKSGIYCELTQKNKPPILPRYFTFSYDVHVRQKDIPTVAKGQYVQHYTLWYDADIKIVRVDLYTENNVLSSKRIYDFKNGMFYETVNSIEKCQSQSLPKTQTLEGIMNLPGFLFPWPSESKYEKPTSFGPRTIQEIEYEVWSSKLKISDAEEKIITDIYFRKMYGEGESADDFTLQLDSLQNYEYASEDEFENKLQQTKYLTFNHYSTLPRDWTVFDVSDCFVDEDKLPFEIAITGSAVESFDYKQFISILFMRLLTVSKVSSTRIGNLKLVNKFGNSAAFTGNVMKSSKPSFSPSMNNDAETEPDMQTAYNNLKESIDTKSFFFNLTVAEKDVTFHAVYFGKPRQYLYTDSNKRYSGGAMAALGVVMTGIGAILGAVGLYVFSKARQRRSVSQ